MQSHPLDYFFHLVAARDPSVIYPRLAAHYAEFLGATTENDEDAYFAACMRAHGTKTTDPDAVLFRWTVFQKVFPLMTGTPTNRADRPTDRMEEDDDKDPFSESDDE